MVTWMNARLGEEVVNMVVKTRTADFPVPVQEDSLDLVLGE